MSVEEEGWESVEIKRELEGEDDLDDPDDPYDSDDFNNPDDPNDPDYPVAGSSARGKIYSSYSVFLSIYYRYIDLNLI